MRNKSGDTAQDLVDPKDEATLTIFRKSWAESLISKDDIASTSAKSPYTAPSYTIAGDEGGISDGDSVGSESD